MFSDDKQGEKPPQKRSLTPGFEQNEFQKGWGPLFRGQRVISRPHFSRDCLVLSLARHEGPYGPARRSSGAQPRTCPTFVLGLGDESGEVVTMPAASRKCYSHCTYIPLNVIFSCLHGPITPQCSRPMGFANARPSVG